MRVTVNRSDGNSDEFVQITAVGIAHNDQTLVLVPGDDPIIQIPSNEWTRLEIHRIDNAIDEDIAVDEGL